MTLVLAAIPMRVARMTFGRSLYWFGHVAVGLGLCAVGLAPFGVSFLVLTVLTGAYAELEGHSQAVFVRGLLAVMVTVGLTAVGTAVWVYSAKIDLGAMLNAQITQVSAQMAKINPSIVISSEALVQQMPSGVLVLLMAALAVGLIGEGRMYHWFNLQPLGRRGRETSDLQAFRVPDAFVWLAILAILGVFLQHGKPWLEALSLNLLNVVIVLYFFQGLAIVAKFFAIFKVGVFWRGFWYLMIMIQLFLLVSLLGFADFWLDFRDRMVKKTTEIDKSF